MKTKTKMFFMPEEVAEMLGCVTVSGLKRLVRLEKIPVSKNGNRYIFSEKDIQAIIKYLQNPPTKAKNLNTNKQETVLKESLEIFPRTAKSSTYHSKKNVDANL